MRTCWLSALLTVFLLLPIPLPPAHAGAFGSHDLVGIDGSAQGTLRRIDLPVTFKAAGFFVAEWDATQQQEARHAGIAFRTLARGVRGEQSFYLFELDDDALAIPVEWLGRVLFRKGRNLLLEMSPVEAEEWMTKGQHAVQLPRQPRGWQPQAELLVPYPCGPSTLVSDLLDRTSQAQWIDWIRKISGADPVTIGGTSYTIKTRDSRTLFTEAADARGFDYLTQQVQSWHYPPADLEEDPFIGAGGTTQKNLVLTIPGQTSPSEVVLLTAHFDTVSENRTVLAPGANDNGTGTATLFEAARLLRQFRFRRTVKIIWFTGEEDGMIGSKAYVADHALAGYLGVLNLDMFGYDGNGDRCFEIHAGTLTSSQQVASCFEEAMTSYGAGLSRDYLTSTATIRSDHSSFWQANVGAIEILENFFDDHDAPAGGCTGSDRNPSYHRTSDTLPGNLSPSFGYDIARVSLATISSMAIPIESCFTAAPSLRATEGAASVDLAWTPVAGAAAYRVYRSAHGCQGQWFEVAKTPSTSWTDTRATHAGAYRYHVEAVAPDGFCVSSESNCASAVPTITHPSAVETAFLRTTGTRGPASGGARKPEQNTAACGP